MIPGGFKSSLPTHPIKHAHAHVGACKVCTFVIQNITLQNLVIFKWNFWKCKEGGWQKKKSCRTQLVFKLKTSWLPSSVYCYRVYC